LEVAVHHNLTDGYVTIEREGVKAADLFDVVHDLLTRIDGLEWAFACLAMISLEHLELITRPSDPSAYRDTVGGLQEWLHDYRLAQERIERDRQFMDSPE